MTTLYTAHQLTKGKHMSTPVNRAVEAQKGTAGEIWEVFVGGFSLGFIIGDLYAFPLTDSIRLRIVRYTAIPHIV